MTPPHISMEVLGAVAWITLSNPDRRNALTPGMCATLDELATEVTRRDDIRVVVVRGDGDLAFAAGADIRQLEPGRVRKDGGLIGIHALARITVPVIAMIRGFCIGGGVAIALDCDIRIASEDAQFAVPATRIGVGYGLAETEALVQVLGSGYASEVLFTGRRYSADEALTMGLVQQVVASGQLSQYVADTATTIAANAPLSVRSAKANIRYASQTGRRGDVRQELQSMINACAISDDFAEGQSAFLERRAPQFRGR